MSSVSDSLSMMDKCSSDFLEKDETRSGNTNITLAIKSFGDFIRKQALLFNQSPSVKLSERGFIREYSSKFDLTAILKKAGVIEENETLISIEDHDYKRGGAECYLSPFKVEVKTEDGNISTKYGVAKAWTSSFKGSIMERRRAHLMNCGMKVVPQFGTLPSTTNPDEIATTLQHHANPIVYESGDVKEAIDLVDILTSKEGADVGKMAAILDANCYKPTSILRNILVTDDGLAFNDFGFDLGDPGPKTEKYYGCEVPVEYFSSIKHLSNELRKNPEALKAALDAYAAERKMPMSEITKAL